MPEAGFPVEMVGGVPVVAAPAEIDITNAAGLRAALREAAGHGNGTVVVNMSQTRFCDSAGLHVLVRAHQRAQAEGGAVRLAACGVHVRRLLAVTGIGRMIPHFPAMDQALPQTPHHPRPDYVAGSQRD